jgi:putative ABC transport system permease protein
LPQYAPPQVKSLDQVLADDSAVARTSLVLLAILAAIALSLALAGIYGVVAFSVERRYHEIGIRLALGARRRRLLSRIVGSSLGQALCGIALGIIASVFGVRAIEHQLFKTAPFDPASFVCTAVLLIACTALASALPAWRALRIDPAQTLRYE